ncbi:MAG: hypothetical protein EZS28_051509, partial [Streblomastix strix]
MQEETQQSGSSQQTVVQKLGFPSRTKPRAQVTDYSGNKGIVLPYETYQKTIGPQLTLNQELKLNKDYQKVRQQASDKRNELVAQSRQQSYAPLMDLIGRNKDIQFKKMCTLITISTKIVTYGEIDSVLNDLIEAKAAYDTVVEKHLINQLTSDSKQDILSTIGADNFKMKYPHTLVLFDDAMSVFKNK